METLIAPGMQRRGVVSPNEFKGQILPDERVLLVGKTRSGKTYWAGALLRDEPRLVVFDPKPSLAPEKHPEWRLKPFKDVYRDLLNGKPGRGRISRLLNKDDWEKYCDLVYDIGNVRVYIDELYEVGPPQGSEGLRKLYTMGRERGIGTWAATQRPAYIPGFAMSEAEHLVLFQTRMPQDIEKMGELMPGARDEIERGGPNGGPNPLVNHQFMVYNDNIGKVLRYEKLTVVAAPAQASK